MYDGHYRRQVRRESGSFSPPKRNSRGGRKCPASLENATCRQTFSVNARSAPDGWMVPQDSKGLLPILTSALCSRTVYSRSTWHALSLSCITNNGLTYVPLINTSADKLASHTSILVWGRLISGAHTGLSICVTITLCVGTLQLKHSGDSG